MTSSIAITGRISPGTRSAGLLSGAFTEGVSEICLETGFVSKQVLSANLLPLKKLIKPVMIYNVFRNPFLRITLFLFISFPLRIQLDLIFGLLYRNYVIFRPVEEYLGAAIITILTFESVLFIKKWLNFHLPWEKNPLRRLIIEIAVNTIIFSAIIALLSYLINLFIVNPIFIKLSDEVLKTVFYLILLVQIPAFIEFAVFLLNRWRTGLAEMEKYKKENAEYRFETLRTQVNPHFLFNSLNTLSSLVYEDRDKAAGFIRDLSDVYRYVLDNRNHETILLSEEIRFIKSFVYLYQLRFDNKLDVEINISENVMDTLIAPMTLQLLVENAIKHNVISVKKPLKITISSDPDGYITVSNNLQKKLNEVASSEIGLKNISSRYAYLTSKAVVISETGSEFIVKVPLIVKS
jgi:two-component system, LytTR family, sensor kinase